MPIPKIFKKVPQTTIKYKKLIIVFIAVVALWFFGLGAIVSWFLTKGSLDKFPNLTAKDRILILAPHIDDEVISSSGLIQQAKINSVPVKIVYLTNGDNNMVSIIKEDKTLKMTPNEFVNLGYQRMGEAYKATAVLGLTAENLVFLGFPDQGLLPMFGKYFNADNPYPSRGTRFTYNPYEGTYKLAEDYTGTNVVNDLKEIINAYAPTIIIVSHPRDLHPDHKATYLFLEKVLADLDLKPKVYAYLVHYSGFPPLKKYQPNDFLYPPRKLFSQKGWLSYDLSPEEENMKLAAVTMNASQKAIPRLYDLLTSLVKKNEIFEEIN